MMGKVGEFGDANNRTIGISLPQRGSFWGHTHFLGTNLRPPTKWLNSFDCLRLFFPVGYWITKWSQHVSTTSTAKKIWNKHLTSHQGCAPEGGDANLEQRFQASGCISNYPCKDWGGSRRILLKNWLVSYNQWEFQDPKMKVLYHIRPYFVGIFPYIGLKYKPYIW